MFYFSSFDESWKVEAEGDVGAYWGLWGCPLGGVLRLLPWGRVWQILQVATVSDDAFVNSTTCG